MDMFVSLHIRISKSFSGRYAECSCLTCLADQLYPFGVEAGDQQVPAGVAEDSSPPVTLEPFCFFSRDEDRIYVCKMPVYTVQ